MKLNTANRSFYTLVAVVAVPYLAAMTLGCGLLSYIVSRVSTDGAAAMTGPGWDVRLALLFFAVIGIAAVASVWSLQRQWRATHGLKKHVRSRQATAATELDIGAIADRAGLSGQVDVVDEPVPFCFTYGIRAPRVAVSAGLVSRATADELGAVLTHERYHVQHNDPFKLVVTRALTGAFFFLPVLGSLHRRYLAARELAADRRAVRDWGRAPLAGALIKAVGGPGWSEVGAAAAIGESDHLGLRIDQLERGAEPALPPLPWPALLASLVSLGVLVVSLAGAVSAAGGRDALMDGGSMWMRDWPVPLVFAACAGGWTLAVWLVLRWRRRSGQRRSRSV